MDRVMVKFNVWLMFMAQIITVPLVWGAGFRPLMRQPSYDPTDSAPIVLQPPAGHAARQVSGPVVTPKSVILMRRGSYNAEASTPPMPDGSNTSLATMIAPTPNISPETSPEASGPADSSATIAVVPVEFGPLGKRFPLPPEVFALPPQPSHLQARDIRELQSIFNVLIAKNDADSIKPLFDNSRRKFAITSFMDSLCTVAAADARVEFFGALLQCVDLYGFALSENYLFAALTNKHQDVLRLALNHDKKKLREDLALVDRLCIRAVNTARVSTVRVLFDWLHEHRFTVLPERYITKALHNQDYEVFRELLERACTDKSPAEQTELYSKAFLLAVDNGSSFMHIAVAMDRADVMWCDKHGRSALHFAVRNILAAQMPAERAHSFGIFQSLCADGCDPFAVDKNKNTPLHLALILSVTVHEGAPGAQQTDEGVRLAVVDAILSGYYVDLYKPNNQGLSPIAIATERWWDTIVARMNYEKHSLEVIGTRKQQPRMGVDRPSGSHFGW
jgi:hypothetical protein